MIDLDGENKNVQNGFYTEILINYQYNAASVRNDIVPDIFS